MSPLGPPVQLAYAVTDVAVTAATFAARTGAGPFFVIEHIPLQRVRVRGHDATFDHSSAYGQWGELMVELVEEHNGPVTGPVTGPPVTGPLIGPGSLHHLAFMVDSLPAAAQWCNDAGWPELLHASTSSGQEFAFHDARAALGHLVELYEPNDRLRGFYAMVRNAAAGWDGSEPVRRLG